ncbi:MAG: alkaline shock response membrane anchor protein AmaP [Alicyclobacillaceae bacterium]|nr:alkaline shock response membrane anchor protein AmaP [Alicyclobacillaceae bacterium]
MNALDRVLLILLCLASFAGGVVVCLAGAAVLAGPDVDAVLSHAHARTAAIVAGVVWALLAVRFFLYRWGRRRLDYVTLPGEHGQVRISYDTIQQLANRAGRSIQGVFDLDTRVAPGVSGVCLALRVRALPDVELSRMSTDIQAAVKSYVEGTAGVGVERVTVNVMEVSGSSGKSAKTRVDKP